MPELRDNLFNKTAAPDEPKLKLWTSMGLMLTYQCPARCEFCYYHCAPEKQSLIPIEDAIAAWQGLERLAGQKAKIHITGGEPFLHWEHLKKLLQKAKELNLVPADMIETNGYWVENQTEAVEKINFLHSCNVKRLKISYDPFHAEFVNYHKVKLLYETACQIIGSDRVLFRWKEYLEKPPNLTNISEGQKLNLFLESYKKYPFRFTGRAATKLAQAIADKEVKQLEAENCKRSFLDSKSIHIDPFGNVFNGVCSGIIIGNITEKPLDELWRLFNPAGQEFLDVLFNKGPAGLLQKATKSGYEKRRLYANKCHLCTDLRQFFFDKGQWRQIIGPKECYL